MASPSSLAIQHGHMSGFLDQRGLSTKQQQAIAMAQAHTAFQSQQQQRRSSSYNFNQGEATTTSLYVGELDLSVDEATLRNTFCPLAPMGNIHLCRDAITNKSLGYAYIDFGGDTKGARALQQLSQTLINGKPCRIMWARRDNNQSSSSFKQQPIATGNLFIKNLDRMVTTKSLLDTFSLYGNITCCKIVTDERGRSKGYGFIHYDTVESAERAINKINGMTLYDREIFVGHHIPKQERIQRIEEAKQRFTNVYVKNLVTDITEEELKELFGGYGPIASVLIQRDDQGVSRGFGFVNFERHEDAEKAVTQMHDTEYIGKRLFVSRAQKRLEREEELRKQHDHLSRHDKSVKYPGVNLYVKNLANSVDDTVLRDLFASFGTITSAKVMRDENTHLSKGFGFVCFTSSDDANKAVVEMNGKTIYNKTIYVAPAQKKEDRKHQLENQLSHQRAQVMHLQQPFVPIPINGYMNGSPIYYDPYSQHSYPSSSSPPQPNIMTPRPLRWNHASPFIMKQSYPAIPLPYSGYTTVHNHSRPPPPPPPHHHSVYDPTRFTPPPPTILSTKTDSFPTPLSPTASYSSTPMLTNTTPEPEEQQSNNDWTMDTLEGYSLETQKQILGERIYKVVNARYPDVAGKVTGMLLEMEICDLIELIKNKHLLEDRAQEAMAVLEQHCDDSVETS
ncbi:hypothetical protein BC941DRAFT_388851 [Chlamydoabsidia padenii]|nr:hypothetical protein BC941DRAFT_388851 [Chlamydoabsidia padenii]